MSGRPDEPWYLDLRQKSGVIFTMNDTKQDMLFIFRYTFDEERLNLEFFRSSCRKYTVHSFHSHKYGNTMIEIKNLESIYEHIIINMERSGETTININIRGDRSVPCAYFINYPLSEEQSPQEQSSHPEQSPHIEQILETIVKYKSIYEFTNSSDADHIKDTKYLEHIKTIYNEKIKMYNAMLDVKQRLDDVTKKIKIERKRIQDLGTESGIECHICSTNSCECVLNCGHFMCNTCIKSLEPISDKIKCPYCNIVGGFHKFYL